MSIEQDSKDFTIEISNTERFLTAFAMAFLSGGALLVIRYGVLSGQSSATLWTNFFFAAGLFGALRLTRACLEQKRRGLHIGSNSMTIQTLFIHQDIPLTDISDQIILNKQSQKNQNDEVTFLWGKNRFRLPCSNADELFKYLQTLGIQALNLSSKDPDLKRAIENKQNQRSLDISGLKITKKFILPLVFWGAGFAGLLLQLGSR